MRNSDGGLAIVTGASSGIGTALALELARRGHPVLAVARRQDRLEAVAAKASALGYARIDVLSMDLTDPSAAETIRAKALSLGKPAWLVNDAGALALGPFPGDDLLQQVRLVRLNCEALIRLTGVFLGDLRAHTQGRILNVGSIAGFVPTASYSVYGATKAFVVSFTEGLSEELRGSNVTATALCPGPATTEIFDRASPGVPRRVLFHEMSAEAVARAGINGALRGRVIVIPGLLNRMLVTSTRLGPRWLVRRVSTWLGLRYLGLPVAEFRPQAASRASGDPPQS